MGDVIRFVDSISATPVVLLDLNSENPCGVTGFSAPPPNLVRSNVQTMLQDGSTDAGSVFGDRVIEIDLDLYAATQDASATYLQALGRLLSDPRGQWLMYQPTGASKPVFFRTKRADIASIEDLLSSMALRELELSIPAEPFAYGLVVKSDPMVIANDPTAATNPMSFSMSSVEGDVATPLALVATNSTIAALTWPCLIASSSQNAPILGHVLADGFSASASASGWTSAVNTDSTAIGGTAYVNSRASGTGFVYVTATTVQSPGDYRVMVRAYGPSGALLQAASVREDLNHVPFIESLSIFGSAKAIGPSWAWVDLGVHRFPFSRVPSSTMPVDASPATPGRPVLRAVLPTSAPGVIGIDSIMLVPAGRDDAVSTRLALTSSQTRASAGAGAVFDAIADVAYFPRSIASEPIQIAGSLPRVVPGVQNFVTFMRAVGLVESKADTTTVIAIYYPRYLHIRPATS